MQQAVWWRPESLWSWLIIENQKCMIRLFHRPAGVPPDVVIIVLFIITELLCQPLKKDQTRVLTTCFQHFLDSNF